VSFRVLAQAAPLFVAACFAAMPLAHGQPAHGAATPQSAAPVAIPPGLFNNEWPDYRQNLARTGVQRFASVLSDPSRVGSLAVRWAFPTTGASGRFLASPIVRNDTVFVGSTGGRFFALDAATGALKWQFPAPASPPLLPFFASPWTYGIQSSAAFWNRDPHGVVICAAQDPAWHDFGSASLFALDAATGALIWKSNRPVAVINGNTPGSTTQLHQRVGYSAPLLFNSRVYVGVADNGDNPIQNGRVVAFDLATGHQVGAFNYASVQVGKRGGGVWNAPATDGVDVYFTTGNTRCDAAGCQSPEPSPNHGLSLVRINKDTGGVAWAFQPVPYLLDNDPDWAAGPSITTTSCGVLVTSVQKDGWTYALSTNGVVHWQFPPTGFPFTSFTHGDDDYKRPGAIWNDVLVITTGGESLTWDGPAAGYGKLHALNMCAPSKQRVRWLINIPNNSGGGYALGAPTVTGGIVFIGTDQGHLVVLADPTVHPASGLRCEDIDFTFAQTCRLSGHRLVPIPAVLANVTLPDHGDIAGLRDEPALARGRVFVATGAGHVYMLAP
jgi:outer membrane protein assembly factor BamB